MYEFHVDRSKLPELPIYPGDTFFWIDDGKGYEIVADTVGAIVIGENELKIIARGDCIPLEIGKDYFLTLADAEKWLAENKPNPPYVFRDAAQQWMPYAKWKPDYNGYYMVKTSDDDSTPMRRAYYDTGACSLVERGFYTSKTRRASRIDHVMYWIDQCYRDSEELYQG